MYRAVTVFAVTAFTLALILVFGWWIAILVLAVLASMIVGRL